MLDIIFLMKENFKGNMKKKQAKKKQKDVV